MAVCIVQVTCPCGKSFGYERGNAGPKRKRCDRCMAIRHFEIMARYRAAHRDALRKYHVSYRQRNRERLCQYSRDYYHRYMSAKARDENAILRGERGLA